MTSDLIQRLRDLTKSVGLGTWEGITADQAANLLEHQSGVMEWQPIETAPRDGGLVDLWLAPIDEATGAKLIPCRVPNAFWEEGRWYLTGVRTSLRVWHNPTHWMPLPTPPVDEDIDNGLV